MNEWIYYEGVYRTAPATPGLLNITCGACFTRDNLDYILEMLDKEIYDRPIEKKKVQDEEEEEQEVEEMLEEIEDERDKN